MTTIRDLASAQQEWLLIDCQHRNGEELAARVSHPESGPVASPAGWLRATVPGLSAQDLIAAGRIADPNYGDNIMAARWIEERDWVYRTVIAVDKAEAAKPVQLVCESLDTFAAVYLNGELVARHENQFRRLVVDLTGKLRVGDNRLAIAFEAPMPATVRRAGPKPAFWNEPWERLYVRKSQMSYGWDWAARTPTVGICDPIRLEFSDGIWLSDLHVRGAPIDAGGGEITATCDIEAAVGWKTGPVIAELLVDGEAVAKQDLTVKPGRAGKVKFVHAIAEAKRWWPKELGEPHLYRVAVRIRKGRTVLHEAGHRCGIRDCALVLKDRCAPNGNVFYFTVNGVRLWAKGDNWLPIDFLHTRTTREQYRAYLELLMAGGVNCIRVWGGGIVEHAVFYDLCDELGLLVWQDFGYACGIYPKDDAFLEEARHEARDVVKRLRSHPCLALWCGNNENEVLAMAAAPAERFHPLYYKILNAVVKELDPDRPYHPGSPASPSGKTHPDSPDEGDRHNWDVWFGWKTTEFIADQARFNSEFGAQAFPQRESLETFLHPDELWTVGHVSRATGPSPGYLFARHGAQLDKLLPRAAAFGPVTGVDALIATTQSFQADTIGRYVRHYRRLLPVSGGVVLWNYTACWPSICWAAVDFYRRPKQAFYECKRCFRPAVVGIEPVDESQAEFAAHISVDRPGTVYGNVTFELRAIADGKVLVSERADVTVKGPSAQQALRIAIPAGLDRRRHALVAIWRHAGGEERDFRYLSPIAEVHGIGGTLTARRFADRVELHAAGWRLRVGVEGLETPAIWDDNYFDMLPGERRVLRIAHGEMPEHLWVVADMGKRKALLPGATIGL